MRSSPSRHIALLAFTSLICCVSTLLPEENEFSLESGSSTEEHCSSIQQQQDDTNVLLQSGRIHIERLGGQDIEEQDQPVENVFKAEQLPLTKFTASSSLSQQGDGKTAFNPLKNVKSSMLSLVSRISSAQGAFAGRGNMGVWLIVSMILCTVIAAIGVFVPAMYDNNDEKRTTYLRTNDMMRHSSTSRENTGLGAGTTATMSGRPFLPSPMQPQRFEPVVRRSENRVTSTFQPYGSQPAPLSPLRVNQPFMPPQSSLPSLASGLPTSGVKAPDDQLAMPMSKRMPPPLCPTLVLPVCEARFGVPMFEIAQLVTEGELGIVGLSGNPLLRASVRKVGRRRSLEISMPEAGSAPRATIAPNIQDLNRPDDGILEIRGLKGSFYGMLEMRASGACYVTKDGETMMIIDGDTDSLQLSIKSGGGMPLASVRCSTEPFGGIDHVEIRVEPGVDTVLVLACVLAVLLLSPTA